MKNEQDLFNENIAAILSKNCKQDNACKVIDEGIRQRALKRLLRVTFSDGKVFCYKSATMTLIETLKKIGIEELQKVKLEVCHMPMISQEKNPKYKDWIKPIGNGWYVMTQSDTDQKFRQLLSIKQQLNLDINIEMGTDFETDKSKGFQKESSKKSSLLVKFPDGEYIGGENPIDTYLAALQKLGLENLRIKGLSITGKPLLTKEKKYNGQVQASNGLWITVPSLTKDKMKHLRVIGAMMHTQLEITLI